MKQIFNIAKKYFTTKNISGVINSHLWKEYPTYNNITLSYTDCKSEIIISSPEESEIILNNICRIIEQYDSSKNNY